MTHWKCPECEAESRYKGLCRDCTEYDDGGSVVSPIHRDRINADGSEYVKLVRPMEPMELSRLKAKFVEQRRRQMTKRQKALATKEAELIKESQSEVVEAAGEEGLLEIGEDATEEE